jgi:hypothetical protein
MFAQIFRLEKDSVELNEYSAAELDGQLSNAIKM